MSSAVTTGTALRPDRSSPMPLWAQVSADLRRRCTSGDFDAGVPGELALCEEYDVSRHTVREALRALRDEGLISSGRGRGSVVRPGFSQSLGAVYSLFASVESQGARQTSDVLRLETLVDADVAARLGLSPDSPLIVLERVRRADDEPLAHDTSYLPMTLAHPLLQTDFSHTALYDELRAIGVIVDSGREELAACVADTTTARLLEVPEGSPVLEIERVAMSSGRPVEFRRTQVRGDRFTLETNWTSGGTTMSLSGSADQSAAADTTPATSEGRNA
jgi:GntR family transcriptional regulator